MFKTLKSVVELDFIIPEPPLRLNAASLNFLIKLASPVNMEVLTHYRDTPPAFHTHLNEYIYNGIRDSEYEKYLKLFHNSEYLKDLETFRSDHEIGNSLYFEDYENCVAYDFQYLSPYRASGFGIGMIPLTEIKCYLELGLAKSYPEYIKSVEEFITSIRDIDSKYVSYHAEKSRKETAKAKNRK